MKIALSGYGKMGKAIEKIAVDRGHQISGRISSSNTEEWDHISKENTDVVIEFSIPESAIENMNKCFEKGIPVVVGTTGWYDELEKVREIVELNNYSLLYASNFSIGVNLFFELNKILARLMSPYDQYTPEITETHHIHKLDAPSGTAITLAEGLLQNYNKLDNWKLDSDSPGKELNIKALRIDEVPGTHEIKYTSEIDDIEIRHEAKSRMGFALGSVIAAEWIEGKSGFFNMSDVLNVNLS